MSHPLHAVAQQFAFAGPALAIALTEIDAEHGDHRTRAGQGSSVRFLVGHLLSCRAVVLQALGARDDDPWSSFGGTESTPDTAEATPLEQLTADWNRLAPEFDAALAAADPQALAGPAPFEVPSDGTLGGMIAFFAWHEAYHVGQIGLLRVEFGLDSLRDTAAAAGA